MWWFLRLSCGGLKFLPSQIAISSKCGAERTLSGWLVSLAAWQFLITALIPNDTVVRLLRCFCLKVVHSCVVKSDAYLFGQNPVCRGNFFFRGCKYRMGLPKPQGTSFLQQPIIAARRPAAYGICKCCAHLKEHRPPRVHWPLDRQGTESPCNVHVLYSGNRSTVKAT